MLPSSRNRFIAGATLGYTVFAALWIFLTDQTVSARIEPAARAGFSTAKGLTFVAVTALLLFVALRAVPPKPEAEAPPLSGDEHGWHRLTLALALPLIAFALQWLFWEQIQPYVWFLFFPAVFFSSWIGGILGGVMATLLSTTLAWYVFIPVRFSFALENPFSIVSIGVFFAMGMLFALTHQRLRQAERRGADAKFRALVDQSLAGIYIIQDGRFRYVNRAFAQMFGYPSPSDMIGRLPLEALVRPDDRVAVAEKIRGCIEGVAASELRDGFAACRTDGSQLMVDIHGRAFVYEGKRAMIGVALDVSERMATEQALKKSEQRLKLALSASSMGVWEWHINSNAVYWSPECFRIFGVYAFDSTLEGFKALIHPEDLGPTFESAGIALRERTTFVAEFRILHADGGIRWVSTMADPVYDRDWEPLSMVGTIRDVTERRRAQDALHQRTEELRLRNAELERFNRASVGRELDMVELKQLVNDLSSQLGRSPPFALNFLEENLPGGSSS